MCQDPTSAVAAKSCIECRRRKIKCDKSIPCSYCVKIKIKCRYPAPKSSSNRDGNSSLSNEVLSARINGIENTLQSFDHSIAQIWNLLQQNHPPSRLSGDGHQSPETRLSNEQTSPAKRTGQGSTPFDSHRPSTYYNIQSDTGSQCPSNHEEREARFRFSPSPSLDSFHPSPTAIFLMWQRYLERIDPVLKILHAPTVQQNIMKVLRDKSYLNQSCHTLLFAIYYTSTITMSAEECRNELQESKGEALKSKRFRNELERSLERSDLLNTSDLNVLQAFVLYLVCGRFDKQGPDTKRLTEVAIKIALRNNLHRDGLELKMTPFEVEIRRRLWWQIYILDVRTAEDSGSDPHILSDSFNTQLPSNINDASLHPDMSEMPQVDPGRTEMSFALVRFEGSNFARRIVFSDKFCQENSYDILSASEKCAAINKFREEIEQRYLSHLDKGIPVDFITAASIRLILVKLKLTVNKPRTRQNQHLIMQSSFRKTCVEILERARLLRRYEKGKQWLWLFQTYIEWDALCYLFIHLSLVPAGDDVQSAWCAANDIYDHWKHHSDTCLDRRWRNIEEQRSRALHARELVQSQPSAFATPPVDGDFEQLEPEYLDPLKLNPPSDGAPVRQTEVIPPPLEGENPIEGLEIPSAGTGCQWSAGTFERYFEVLNMEHDLHSPWL
ncbi:Bikaverin cluster transcription factor bik5 [Penicillium rolfsii]|nr:Bikaverin cluster transcription factor bik5 [Penicillium rolfsii]